MHRPDASGLWSAVAADSTPTPEAAVAPGGVGSTEHPKGGGAGIAALGISAVAFSWGFVFVKVLPLAGATIAFWRLVIGGGATLAAAIVLRAPRPKSWGAVIAAGLCFGVHQLLYIAATQRTSIAIVTLAGALQPLVVALSARRLVGERVAPALYLWSLVAFAGLAVVVVANLDHPSRSLSGDLLSLANLFSFTAFFLFSKRARSEGVSTLTLTTGMLLGALVVVAPALAFVASPLPHDAAEWLLIAALALLPGNGHLLVNWAHRRVSATLASLVLLAVPLLAAIWARLWFDEPYGLRHFVGMLLVLAAVEGGRRSELASMVRAERAAATSRRLT
jgi:drug/metabolite transporter (DMT)-like permease